MLKMKSTMKNRSQPQATQQKYWVVEIYMVVKRCENTIHYQMVDRGKSLWENKNWSLSFVSGRKVTLNRILW